MALRAVDQGLSVLLMLQVGCMCRRQRPLHITQASQALPFGALCCHQLICLVKSRKQKAVMRRFVRSRRHDLARCCRNTACLDSCLLTMSGNRLNQLAFTHKCIAIPLVVPLLARQLDDVLAASKRLRDGKSGAINTVT